MSTATAEIPMHQKVQSFVAAPRKMLIGGKWLDSVSGKTFPTYNPATGEVLARVAEGDHADVDRAVASARDAFEHGPWRRLTASERGRLIWKLADLLESHQEEFAQLESLDNGKPVGVARAADVPLAVDLFRYMAGWATKSKATPSRFPSPIHPALNIWPTRCASRSAWSRRSSPGIFRCSWRPGSWARPSPPAAPSS